MNASLLIKKAAAEGVNVKLESDNKLKACGPSEARAKWLPILREHRSELLAELTGVTLRPSRPPLRQGGKSWRTNDGEPVPAYDPARLQREADRRNAAASREAITDRFCRCGHLATFAWSGDDGRDVWVCAECLRARGRA